MHNSSERKYCYKILSSIWLILIFYLCLSSGVVKQKPVFEFEGMDKVAHFTFYFVLTWLMVRMFFLEMRKPLLASIILTSFIGSCVGISIEWIQGNFIKGRSCDINDVLFNTFGIIVAASLTYFLNRNRNKSL